ncbi:MAG: hypothetical protein WBB24_00365 [Maribacter sp.]
MRKNIVGLILMTVVLFSCSSDKNEGNSDEATPLNAILGTWDATSLNIDVSTASQDAILAQQFLNILTEDGCYVLTLQFNEDLTATATNSANYIAIDASTLNVPCPTQSDVETSTYTFDGSVVTILNASGETLSVDARIDGDMMYVDAADLEIPEFTESGELVFTKR